MAFKIVYADIVAREDISLLPKIWREKIKEAIEKKLMTHPSFYGKPLRFPLQGYWKLRVGDYRVAFRINSELETVKIFIIKHRKYVYEILRNRVD